MQNLLNRQVLLRSRPTGEPRFSDFELVESPVPAPGEGELLCRTIYLSLDPYMRGRMNDVKSYAQPVELGKPMVGGAVSEVIASNHTAFPTGSFVVGNAVDRKSTRLNSSHQIISYAVFCLKKKKTAHKIKVIVVNQDVCQHK